MTVSHMKAIAAGKEDAVERALAVGTRALRRGGRWCPGGEQAEGAQRGQCGGYGQGHGDSSWYGPQ